MNKILASIIITNYNKKSFIKKTIESAVNQNFKNKEIIVYDDKSTDGSIAIIKKFKKIKVLTNKSKKKSSNPLNQINAILKCFEKSKGNYIFLLDGDDQFKLNKIKNIIKIFNKYKDINLLQDKPYLINKKRVLNLKNKKHFFSIWPSIYPTSCIAIRRDFFNFFLNYIKKNNYKNLEIDSRLVIFSSILRKYKLINKTYTNYIYDNQGISSKYNKFSKNWWKKRYEAFDYLIYLSNKFGIKFSKGPDYYLTKIINCFFIFE